MHILLLCTSAPVLFWRSTTVPSTFYWCSWCLDHCRSHRLRARWKEPSFLTVMPLKAPAKLSVELSGRWKSSSNDVALFATHRLPKEEKAVSSSSNPPLFLPLTSLNAARQWHNSSRRARRDSRECSNLHRRNMTTAPCVQDAICTHHEAKTFCSQAIKNKRWREKGMN